MMEEWMNELEDSQKERIEQWKQTLLKSIEKKKQRRRSEKVASLYLSYNDSIEFILQYKRAPQDVPLYIAYSIYDEEKDVFLRPIRNTRKLLHCIEDKSKSRKGIIVDQQYADPPYLCSHVVSQYAKGKIQNVPLQDQYFMMRLHIGMLKIENKRRFAGHNMQDATILLAQSFFHQPMEAYLNNGYTYHASLQRYLINDEEDKIDIPYFISFVPLKDELIRSSNTINDDEMEDKANDENINNENINDRNINDRNGGEEESDDILRCVLRLSDVVTLLSPYSDLNAGSLTTLSIERSILGALAGPIGSYIYMIRRYGIESPTALQSGHVVRKKDNAFKYSRENNALLYEVIRSLLPTQNSKSLPFNPFLQYVKLRREGHYLLLNASNTLADYIHSKRERVHYNQLTRNLRYPNLFVLHCLFKHINNARKDLYGSLPKQHMIPVNALYIYSIQQLYPLYLAYPTIYFTYQQLYAHHLYKLLQTRDEKVIKNTIQQLPVIFKKQIIYFQYAKNRPYNKILQNRFVHLMNFLYNKIIELFPEDYKTYISSLEKSWNILIHPSSPISSQHILPTTNNEQYNQHNNPDNYDEYFDNSFTDDNYES